MKEKVHLGNSIKENFTDVYHYPVKYIPYNLLLYSKNRVCMGIYPCLSKNKKNIKNLSSVEKFQFFTTWGKICTLHGRVFIMQDRYTFEQPHSGGLNGYTKSIIEVK